MSFPLTPMRMEDYAHFEGLLGSKIVKTGTVYWRSVRPWFFRPLPVFKEFPSASIAFPRLGLLGGIQHAVPPDDPANSFLSCLMFENANAYSIETLDSKRRRQVRLASNQYAVRVVTDAGEFKEKAYRAYRSFYERTKYKVGSMRLDPAYFPKWTDAIFRIPGLLILGGYLNGELVGISLSFLIEDTVMYATFFCDSESLRQFLSDLMLHSVRESAAACSGVTQVFVGMYKGITGVGDFYLLRNAVVVRKRAALRLNPFAKAVLKCCLPKTYAKMRDPYPLSPEPGGSM